MTNEPREIRLPRRLLPSVRPVEPASAIDEAFASVTDADFRRDRPHDGADENVSADLPKTETADLAALVRDQLAALTLQQSSLKALLDSLSK